MAAVSDLLSYGTGVRDIARLTGVPESTIHRWKHGTTAAFVPLAPRAWRPADPRAYSYLLGIYLGDGCLSVSGRNRVLFRVTLDALYAEIVCEVREAMLSVVPACRVNVVRLTESRMSIVQSAGRRWLDALPQHGPGRKHERRILLAEWQRDIVDQWPDRFLRGLIHSDGCRTVNRFRTELPSGRVGEYHYVRYFFSNLSPDIRALFCQTCERLGVRWTQSNPRNISVSHRLSVKLLDTFVGPKA